MLSHIKLIKITSTDIISVTDPSTHNLKSNPREPQTSNPIKVIWYSNHKSNKSIIISFILSISSDLTNSWDQNATALKHWSSSHRYIQISITEILCVLICLIKAPYSNSIKIITHFTLSRLITGSQTQVTYQVYISKNPSGQVNPIYVHSSSNMKSKIHLRLIIYHQQDHQYSNSIIRGKIRKMLTTINLIKSITSEH